ncbi:hypothetical protein BDN70DRAFT_692585 [Pholiota conissans]|uniref:Uncharacterized protein n=1 Tax=Pholiota conissans TaxID=109636 RepID=A0A9P5Z231_9AGAR|nr:hypothetical protein BDN70DRAFT_692585 [Pholiota conissans]
MDACNIVKLCARDLKHKLMGFIRCPWYTYTGVMIHAVPGQNLPACVHTIVCQRNMKIGYQTKTKRAATIIWKGAVHTFMTGGLCTIGKYNRKRILWVNAITLMKIRLYSVFFRGPFLRR